MAIGASFFACADEISLARTALFAQRVIDRLRHYGKVKEKMPNVDDEVLNPPPIHLETLLAARPPLDIMGLIQSKKSPICIDK